MTAMSLPVYANSNVPLNENEICRSDTYTTKEKLEGNQWKETFYFFRAVLRCYFLSFLNVFYFFLNDLTHFAKQMDGEKALSLFCGFKGNETN